MVASDVYAANGKSAKCLNHDVQIVFYSDFSAKNLIKF